MRYSNGPYRLSSWTSERIANRLGARLESAWAGDAGPTATRIEQAQLRPRIMARLQTPGPGCGSPGPGAGLHFVELRDHDLFVIARRRLRSVYGVPSVFGGPAPGPCCVRSEARRRRGVVRADPR